MSWYDFVNSEHNTANKFSLGSELFNSEGQQIYTINYDGAPICTNSDDMYDGCEITSIAYIKPAIYE
jgi:hypothetical protein